MIEATLTLAALIPLAGYAGWHVGRSWPQPHPNADDYRNRAERAEAALAEALAELHRLTDRAHQGDRQGMTLKRRR